MTEIHAKPIIDDKFWIVEKDGDKIATLQKQENNKFILSNIDGEIKFDKKEEIIETFGSSFFLPQNTLPVNIFEDMECHGYPTKTKPYNSVYDVRKKLPMFTKQPTSKCYHCAGWYVIKLKSWSLVFCPKLITVERYETYGPYKSKEKAMEIKCTHI